MKILSWNVNGIRAIEKKGFVDWLITESPEILCVQETKARAEQLSDKLKNPNGYESFWHLGERKGYSGVGVYVKKSLLNKSNKIYIRQIITDFGSSVLSLEGRTMLIEFNKFKLFNIYFPNGKANTERLDFKLRFYEEFVNLIKDLIQKKQKIIVCGDVNTAHTEIDLARPKENSKISGFLPEERVWLDKFIKIGLVDTFRVFNRQGGFYTWWDLKSKARQRNVGWRIDYFYISKNLLKNLKSAFILDKVYGSDHCPIGIEIDL